jgi:hypothetical protein
MLGALFLARAFRLQKETAKQLDHSYSVTLCRPDQYVAQVRPGAHPKKLFIFNPPSALTSGKIPREVYPESLEGLGMATN